MRNSTPSPQNSGAYFFPTQQPGDFLLLRVSIEKVYRGTGSEGLAIRCPNFMAKTTTFAQNFGCVAYFVDLDILALVNPPSQRTAWAACSGNGADRCTMPDRRFAARLPIDASMKTSRVVNIFGLRHCVEAAKERLVQVSLREEQWHVLRLGPKIAWRAMHHLRPSGVGKVIYGMKCIESAPIQRCSRVTR